MRLRGLIWALALSAILWLLLVIMFGVLSAPPAASASQSFLHYAEDY